MTWSSSPCTVTLTVRNSWGDFVAFAAEFSFEMTELHLVEDPLKISSVLPCSCSTTSAEVTTRRKSTIGSVRSIWWTAMMMMVMMIIYIIIIITIIIMLKTITIIVSYPLLLRVSSASRRVSIVRALLSYLKYKTACNTNTNTNININTLLWNVVAIHLQWKFWNTLLQKKGQRKTKTSWCISQNLIVDIWQLEKLLNVFSSNFSSLTNWFNQGPSWYLLPVTVFGCFSFSNKKNTIKSATKADVKIG